MERGKWIDDYATSDHWVEIRAGRARRCGDRDKQTNKPTELNNSIVGGGYPGKGRRMGVDSSSEQDFFISRRSLWVLQPLHHSIS